MGRVPATPAFASNAIGDRQRSRGEAATNLPESRSKSDQRTRLVHRALEGLSERQRTLVELTYWSGLSQAEIATQLDIPLTTVKTRTRGALTRLAELLDCADHE